MASAVDSKPLHSNSNLIDTFPLNNDPKTSDAMLPPSGRQHHHHHHHSSPRRGGGGGTEEHVHISTGQGRADDGMHKHHKCSCSHHTKDKRHRVQHDAFTSPHKMLSQRVSSANKLKNSQQVAKCEAVQIVDLKVATIDREMQNELSPDDKLVSIPRPGSGQAPAPGRRKKHHIMFISREPRDSSTPRKQLLESQSYEQLSNLAVRYADHRKNPTTNLQSQAEEAEGSATRPNTPSVPNQVRLSTVNLTRDADELNQLLDDPSVKQKSAKQVRINSAVQVLDDSENSSMSYPKAGPPANVVREITKLRHDSSGTLKVNTRPETPGFKLPENLPPGSVVRIQHTSKGKIKVITGTEGQFTTTILEGAKKRPGGHRPATTLDLMDDVLVITRKASTSKDLTSRPPSGNSKAIEGGQRTANDNNSPTRKPELLRTKTSEGFVHRKSDNNQIQVFKERAAQAAHTKAAQLVREAKQKKIETNNPYLNINESKTEASNNNAVSLYYQSTKNQPTLSARQQRWKPEESLAADKDDRQASGRYKLLADASDRKPPRHVTFKGDKTKSKSSDNLDLVEEDYVSPTRYKWELEYEGYVQERDSKKNQGQGTESDSDFDIVDAQTLAAKQYYAARHNYVKNHRRVHTENRRQHSPEKAKTHTVVMAASKTTTNNSDPSLPPKQQLWSKETLLQSAKSPYATAPQPPAPRSPSRSRSRRRSARSRTNTNLVADHEDSDSKKGKATELFDENLYENFAHSKFQSRSRPSSSSRSRPKVVDRETMVKLLHMTMPKKQSDENEQNELEVTKM